MKIDSSELDFILMLLICVAGCNTCNYIEKSHPASITKVIIIEKTDSGSVDTVYIAKLKP